LNITATGATGVSDADTLVVFRDSFDAAYGDGTNRPISVSGAANEVFVLPAATGNGVTDVYKLQSGNLRVQSVTLGKVTLVRLLAREDTQEHASAWVSAQVGARLAIGSVNGMGDQPVILLEGAMQSLALPLEK
jgi:hypothetical protein